MNNTDGRGFYIPPYRLVRINVLASKIVRVLLEESLILSLGEMNVVVDLVKTTINSKTEERAKNE